MTNEKPNLISPITYPARQEHPNPQFKRDMWLNLNGQWDFTLDKNNVGVQEKWYEHPQFSEKIQVPFAYQTELSQVHDKTPADWCWYHRKVTIPEAMKGKQIHLHFGAVDYYTWVYVNGKLAGEHEGGHTSFFVDITQHLVEGEQSITLRIFDPLYDESIPRGKQSWTGGSHAIWYTPTTGIWQTVWLEAVEPTHIRKLRLTPDIDKGVVTVETAIAGELYNHMLDIKITFDGREVVSSTAKITDKNTRLEFDVLNNKIFNNSFHHNGLTWTPETPNLFDIIVSLKFEPSGREVDTIESYFGMRKIHASADGRIYLNNKPYYQKLVLDQGYWPGALLTAPTDEDYKTDIRLAKEMGFNGARKHQKVEDPRFLYWADKMGFIVWGECAAPPAFNEDAVARLTREWLEIIERDYNHPCIVTWVPFNESWGIPNVGFDKQQQNHTLGLYYTIKALDPTRFVISNDGWENTVTDILAFHTYEHGNEHEVEKYTRYKNMLATKDSLLNTRNLWRNLYANGFSHRGEPILLTEFGGIAYKVDGTAGWGYTSTDSADGLIKDYARLMDAISASQCLYGYCYTQITDVEQEINGLLTYDRKPKCDLAKIREQNARA